MVRGPRLVATRASAGATRKGPRRSLGALDCTDRRRKDAGRILADAGGVVFSRSNCSPPPAKRRGGGGGGGAPHSPPPPFFSRCNTLHPPPPPPTPFAPPAEGDPGP